MSIKSDIWIETQCLENQMIVPFIGGSMSQMENGQKVTSFGLTSYGYDIRLGRNFKFYKQKPEQHGALVFGASIGGGPARMLYKSVTVAREFVSYLLGSGPRSHPVLTMDRDTAMVIDPCDFNEDLVQEIDDCDVIVIPPKGFVLGVSQERFKVPRNITGVCMGKSTVARAGIIVIVTPLEPGWEGYLTLEIYNTTDMPVKLTPGMGITQLQFFEGEPCRVSYDDRKGKYQNQPAVAVTPKAL